MDAKIEEMANSCTSCQRVRNNPPLAPLHPWEFPQRRWQRIHIDFAGPVEDRMLLVAVDAHSKWPEVAIMRSTTTGKTIEKLGEMFSRFGFPEQLVSDNGPQFVSQEMAGFLQANGVQHITSAPYHPATNGLAERFVQTLKHALKTSQGQGTLHQRLHHFLQTYRSSPHAATKVSPASLMLMGEMRTTFDLLKPATVRDTVLGQQEKQVHHREKRARDRVFTPGESVLARNYRGEPKWVPATVLSQTGPVSYTVQMENQIWRRHVDQLLRASQRAEGLLVPPRDIPDTPVAAPVTLPTADLSAPGPATPVSPACGSEEGTETLPSAPNISSPAQGTMSPPSSERRYPNRERRAPTRLDL